MVKEREAVGVVTRAQTTFNLIALGIATFAFIVLTFVVTLQGNTIHTLNHNQRVDDQFFGAICQGILQQPTTPENTLIHAKLSQMPICRG